MKKKINSRAKGASAERELANYLSLHGFPARRGQQFSGGAESPDVICPSLPGYHLEVKRVESGNLYKWMAQAKKDAGVNRIPLVIHRKSNQEWVAVIRLEDLLNKFLLMGI